MLEINGISSVYLPNQSGAQSEHLMVVLHGLGDSLEGYRFLPEFFGVNRFDHLLLNAPDDYYTGFSWFDIYGDPAPGVARSRELLFSLVQQLENQGYSPEKLIFFGFSQGCLMVIDLACRYPKSFAGIVGISGYVWELESYPAAFSPAAKKQNFFVTHGTLDPVLPIGLTRKQVSSLKNMGLNICWQEYLKDHTIDPTQEKQDIASFLVETIDEISS